MSREFDLLDTIRLWDSMFADLNRNEFMTYLCCAMVLEQRELLFKGDFSDNLRLVRVRWRNGRGSEGRDMFHPFCLLLFIFSTLIHIMLIFLFMS